MSQSNDDSLKTDFSVCDVSQSSPDLTSHGIEYPGATLEGGVNGNSGSLSNDAFKLKLDDLGVEVVKDRDHDKIVRRDRLDDTQYRGTDKVGWPIAWFREEL